MADVRAARTEEKVGHSGRDDNEGGRRAGGRTAGEKPKSTGPSRLRVNKNACATKGNFLNCELSTVD